MQSSRSMADWSPTAIWTELLSLVWSPYDNPFYVNLLGNVIAAELPDFNVLNDDRAPHLFVCATNVRTNQRRIFGPGELSGAALTASACLPTIFRSVEVNGESYWDGGYLGNPALYPLRSPALTADHQLIHAECGNAAHTPLNPSARVGIPGRRWVMVIDLAKCDGCGQCTGACSKMHFVPPSRQWIKVLRMQESEKTAPYFFPPVQETGIDTSPPGSLSRTRTVQRPGCAATASGTVIRTVATAPLPVENFT